MSLHRTLLLVRVKVKKKTNDIKAGEEVLSLDEETGGIVSNKVKTLLWEKRLFTS